MEQHCKLCSSIINEQNFTVIKCDEQGIFDILLLKLNFDNTVQYVICGPCSEILSAAVNFKSTCLDCDNTIILYVDFANPLPVDLSDIYRMENEMKDTPNISHDERICRLCMHPIDVEYISLDDIPVEIIDIYIPELNLNVTIDPVICKNCYNSLCTYSNFIKKCNGVEEKMYTDESIVKETPSDSYIKMEDIDIKSDGSDRMEEEYVEFSFSDIKSETFEKEDDLCQSKTEYKNDFRLTHEDPSEVQRNKYNSPDHLASYQVVHRNDSEDKLRISHQLINENPSEVQMYKCEEFQLETKHKSHLKTHELVHKGSYEGQYETEVNKNLQSHRLVHTDPSQVQIYKCDECPYQTKHKNRIKTHQLVHQNSPEVKMYKCDKCEYKCKRMCQFKLHQSTHKKPSEMYRCSECQYKTKIKHNLQSHQLKHEDSSEVQVYKCDECPYETKYSRHFKSHQLVHKAEVCKCDKYKYNAKRKMHLKNQQMTHRNPSKAPVYRCNVCVFETKYKKSIKAHQFKHKTASEGDKYKCDICHVKCRLKRDFLKHKCALNKQN